MKDRHQKHPKLEKPSIGHYHRKEWAIYGTNCGRISDLYNSIKASLSPEYNLMYVDADHHVEQEESRLHIGKKIWVRDEVMEWNEYDDRLFSLSTDLVLVNGNHYPADRQIVVIDKKKEASLLKRIEQLTQIDIILVEDEDTEIYEFVKEKMTDDTSVISIDDIDKLVSYIKDDLNKKNVLKALILSGGKSSRMGQDKSQIRYHGVQQELFLADLCSDIGLETYISKSYDAEDYDLGGYKIIKDRMIEMGPFGAIISAMMIDPDAAWLVLAVDLPLLDKKTIVDLITNRNTSKYATAYRIPGNPFPEPLITIYEPQIYPRMLQLLSLGYCCPRKILINSDIEIREITDADKLMNANTMTEKDIAMERIYGDENIV